MKITEAQRETILREDRVNQLRNMPLIQHRAWKSNDGRFIIDQMRITSIKPIEYYDTVLKSKPQKLDKYVFD